MAAGKVISIEIGYSLTRICETDYKSKTHKVYSSCTIPTMEGVFNDGTLALTQEYVESIKSAFALNRMKSKQVVFSITSAKIASREVVIPFVKENRIADVVNANASDYFPVDLSQYQLAYTILGTLGETKGSQQYKLLVMAAPTALLSGYYDLAKALKLEVAAIDYAGNSVYQMAKSECTEGVHLIVKIDERASLVMAVQDSVMAFTRNVSYGAEEALETVMESLCWGEVSSMEQAIRVMQRNECIATEEGQETAESSKDKAREEVRKALVPLIGGIARVIDYYVSRNPNTTVNRVILAGLGADFKGIDVLLSKEINYPVELLKKSAGWNFGRDFKNECFGEYLACLGATTEPLGFKKEAEKAKEKSRAKSGGTNVNGAVIAYTLLGVGLAAAIVLVVISVVPYMNAQKLNAELKAQSKDLESIIPVYNEYVETKATYTRVNAMYEVTRNRNDGLYEFLLELEEKLPSNVAVVSFTSESETVTINMNVSTKEEAAAAIEQLRTFESLIPSTVTVSSLVEREQEENGVTEVNFTVIASYMPVMSTEESASLEASQTEDTQASDNSGASAAPKDSQSSEATAE